MSKRSKRLFMLNSILQTLAELLAGGTILTSTEQIDFSHPSSQGDGSRALSLNLYLYDVRSSKKMPNTGRQVERRFEHSQKVADIIREPSWFDVSIVITARDRTVMGENRLLSEVLVLFMRYRFLQEEFLSPDLRGHGSLPLSVTNAPPIDVSSLWGSFSGPIRPAVYLTVTVPLDVWRKTTVPLVLERRFSVSDAIPALSESSSAIRRVAISGTVRNVLNSKPLRRVRVMLEGTERAVLSNEEGFFFFENIRPGNYVLQFRRFGYRTDTCSVLVDEELSPPRDIFLNPYY
jgi:Pvc16 N-terminal domain/Carboxypeptidase regulatory-like domain